MDVEFAVFVDVLFDAVEEDGGDEVLRCGRLRRDEDFGCSKGSVRCP